ncbi:terminal nucleotidyltransferase 4A-like [Asterias rubens]|uniref:terminal nucleotidyltransferase 4A-like n=1 Tax=Asterias rubens TaxID=7604 RepID=UPI0014555788|nr:terminal nucleotidyltransferase 4A-like [Asterias rubens]
MDPRSTWYQPEQLGPATELWTRIFNSATQNFRDLQMGDSKAGDRNGLNEYESRNRTLPPRDSQDFIPLHGDSGTDLATKRSAINGYQNGERTSSNNIFNKRRKDNLASTYDWNSSGKLRDGGTPWWSRRNAGSHHGLPYPDLTNHNVELGLSREIEDFYYFMYPRAEEHWMRREVVQRIEGIVKNIWPEARVDIYGSYRTMLYLPTSDIDLVVFGDLGDCPYFRIGNELEKSNIAEMGSIKVLDKASVPIVKLTDDLTKVKVDISFNMRTGTACAKLIEDFIKQFPRLPYLVFVLKQFLLQRDLNEVWTGGISSYSLILMAVSFLQMHVRPEPTNLGVQLIEFFELYGVNFNYFKTGISVMDGGRYFSKEDAREKMAQGYRTSLLCIEDPLNPGTDICKSSYGFMEVRKAFGYAYSVLKQGLLTRLDQENYIDSILGRIVRVTDEVIEYRQWIHVNWAHKVPPPMIYTRNCMMSIPPPQNIMRLGGSNNTQLIGNTVNATLDNNVDNIAEGRNREASEDTSNANTGVALNVQGTESEVNSLASLPSTPDALSSASDTDSDLSSQASGSSKDSVDNTPERQKPSSSTPSSPTEDLTQTHGSLDAKVQKSGSANTPKDLEVRTLKTLQVVSDSKPLKEDVPSKSTAAKEKPSVKEELAKPSQSPPQQAVRTATHMVTSRTYRNSNHQQSSKFRSSSVGGSGALHGSSGGISNTGNGSGSSSGNNGRGGSNNNNNINKKIKRKHKKDNNSNPVR